MIGQVSHMCDQRWEGLALSLSSCLEIQSQVCVVRVVSVGVCEDVRVGVCEDVRCEWAEFMHRRDQCWTAEEREMKCVCVHVCVCVCVCVCACVCVQLTMEGSRGCSD